MDSHPKIVDITLSNSDDDSDFEFLSLQERINLFQKRSQELEKVDSTPHIKNQVCSLPDRKMCIVNKKDDSDSDEFELPSLEDVYGLQSTVKPFKIVDDEIEMLVEVPGIVKEISTKYEINLPGREFQTKLSYTGDSYKTNLVQISKHLKKPHNLHSCDVQLEDNPSESEECTNVLTEVPIKAKKACTKKAIDVDKELAKQERIRLREEKKQEREMVKALKASEKEVQKSQKPDELLKGMKVIIDQNLIFQSQSEDIFSALDEGNLKYNIEENPVNLSVIWCKTVFDITVDNNQVLKNEREVLENVLILYIPNENFVKMVYSFLQKSKGRHEDSPTLLDYIANIKSMFPQMDVTCAVVGIANYFRSIKDKETCDIVLKKMVKQVSKTIVEEATVEVQLQTFVNFNFLNTMREFGELLARFSKAIAEAPQRREKQVQKGLAFSWFADADSSCPVKIGRDGDGLMKLWQQQIQQFNNVGPEVAEAVSSKYPSLQILMQAYKRCSSTKEAEALLQDIVVRRNYGPLGTQRRIGPELSYKIFLFFMSKDGNQVLQR